MIAISNHTRGAGIQRAAVLVASLDDVAAELLLEQLDPECADMVREAADNIDQISSEQRQRILDDFRRIQLMVPRRFPAGIDLECQAARAGALSARGPQSSDLPGDGEDDPIPFGFLRDADRDRLASVLSKEAPQAVAMVLSHLPPPQAGDVLARLAPPVQVEVVRRLLDIDTTDSETIRDVERALERRLSCLFARERQTEARDPLATILAACKSELADAILDNLADYDEALAERLGRKSMEFDDLAAFDDAALLAVFREAEPDVAQLALVGAAPELVERILNRMVPREAGILRQTLNHPKPFRLSDLDAARRRIVEIASHRLRSCRSTKHTPIGCEPVT